MAGRGRKNTRRFSRNITVDFISCSNVNDGPEILTYRNISFSLSLSLCLSLKGSQRDDFVSVEKRWRERERKRELSFPFDERKISVCGLYVRVARFRTEISRVNVFAAEKYERRRESFEKSAINATDFVSLLFFYF